ncbi:MAG TPA: BBE domain-containing protein, partial [Gemmatimonadaceae bacterium]|nr:BBE domain-containing protein [Gemmatimonadaceae bacterium]
HPDLFWALRGGRTNFGVATAIEIDLVPVRTLYGGSLFFDAPLIEPALRTFLGWTRDLPDAMTSSLAVIPFPDVPAVPEPLRGRHVAHVRIAYVGDAGAGERLITPLRGIGPRLMESLTTLPYSANASIYNEPTAPVAYYQSNAMLEAIDDDLIRAILDLGIARFKVVGVIEIRHLGGAMARPPAVDNAVGHRAAQYLLRIITPRLEPADTAAVKSGHESLLSALEPRTLGYCLNFMSAGTRPEAMSRFYDADAYRRLVELKAIYDPANRFRFTNAMRG